jgi:hypothetical protein
MNATSVDQIKQIVHDENVYVVNQNYLISLVQPYAFFLSQPWLKGFNGQYGSTCGTVGPLLGFEYEARFWIDPSAR